VQIIACYSHSSHKTNPNPNTNLNPGVVGKLTRRFVLFSPCGELIKIDRQREIPICQPG